jgi:hypothetical protein
LTEIFHGFHQFKQAFKANYKGKLRKIFMLEQIKINNSFMNIAELHPNRKNEFTEYQNTYLTFCGP